MDTVQLTSRINLFKVGNWDQNVLYGGLPPVAPVYMGKSWTPESTNFDVSTLHLTNLKRDVKVQLELLVKQNLDKVVSSPRKYTNAMTSLALDVEALSIELTCELLSHPSVCFRKWFGEKVSRIQRRTI
jgi:hypothetical protein